MCGERREVRCISFYNPGLLVCIHVSVCVCGVSFCGGQFMSSYVLSMPTHGDSWAVIHYPPPCGQKNWLKPLQICVYLENRVSSDGTTQYISSSYPCRGFALLSGYKVCT